MTKEQWYENVFKEVLNPKANYWRNTELGLIPNLFSDNIKNYENHFKCMGILVAMAILDGYNIDVKFAPIFIK